MVETFSKGYPLFSSFSPEGRILFNRLHLSSATHTVTFCLFFFVLPALVPNSTQKQKQLFVSTANWEHSVLSLKMRNWKKDNWSITDEGLRTFCLSHHYSYIQYTFRHLFIYFFIPFVVQFSQPKVKLSNSFCDVLASLLIKHITF